MSSERGISIRPATRDDLPALAELELEARVPAVDRGELPAVDLGLKSGQSINDFDKEEALKATRLKLEKIIQSDYSAVLVAQLPDGRRVGKLQINFIPEGEAPFACLGSVEVAPEAEGIGIAMALVRQAITVTRARFPKINKLALGRYDKSEDYRRTRGRSRVILFDWLASLGGVEVRPDVWEGESMKWFSLSLEKAEQLLNLYEKLWRKFPIG